MENFEEIAYAARNQIEKLTPIRDLDYIIMPSYDVRTKLRVNLSSDS